MADPFDLREEQELVERCLAHDKAAHDQFVRRYEGALLKGIRSKLICKGQDLGEAEEIAEQFWFSILRADWRGLVGFDPTRGGLATYMYVLGGQRASIWLRQKRRHQQRVRSRAMDTLPDPQAVVWAIESAIEDLRFALSPALRQFLQDYLDRRQTRLVEIYTPAQCRVLKHRLLRSLERFLCVRKHELRPRRSRRRSLTTV